MKARFTVQSRLPGLNEIIGANRGNRFGGAAHKKKFTKLCAQYVISDKVPTFDKPVKVTFFWCEKDKRRDIDNIQAGSKFIVDALVELERLPDDSQKWVKSVSHKMLEPERETPHVIVEIQEET